MPTISPSSTTLTIEPFCALDRPDLAELYCAGQLDSYRRHPGSLGAIVPGVVAEAFGVLARTGGGDPVGGMRVHLRRPDVPLPVERALGALCPIAQAIARAPAPLVELCGTWVASAHRGTGLAAALTAAALAVARALAARRIVACAHQHALALYRRFGAEVDDALGVFPYPDPRYRTCVIWADPSVCPEEQIVDHCAAAFRRGQPVTFDPVVVPAAA